MLAIELFAGPKLVELIRLSFAKTAEKKFGIVKRVIADPQKFGFQLW